MFSKGDKVFYVGTNAKVRQDYGDQVLEIIAIDQRNLKIICRTQDNLQLVGVVPQELQQVQPWIIFWKLE